MLREKYLHTDKPSLHGRNNLDQIISTEERKCTMPRMTHCCSQIYMHSDNAMPHNWNDSQNTFLASTLGQ